jgi:[ribosomal protein S5]-alanine N-acetyltransferase
MLVKYSQHEYQMILETKNLKLISCDRDILECAIAGNDVLAKKINVFVEDGWTEFGTAALQYSLEKLSASEEEKNWWTYFPVHKEDNMLIGSGGYKGKPTNEGMVEIGYEIATAYRNRGLATEMAHQLIEHAFHNERVKMIIAHTLGLDNPSTRVLQKCGFKKVEELNDAQEGIIWKWELKKPVSQ